MLHALQMAGMGTEIRLPDSLTLTLPAAQPKLKGIKKLEKPVMFRRSKLMYSAVASVAVIAAQPAWADVTPQQVWDDLEAYMTSFGYSVTGTESTSGNALTITDMGLSMDIPEGGGTMAFSASEVTFEDLGDGSVRVTFPENMPIQLKMNDVPDGEPFDLTIDYAQQGLQMVVSGEPGDMVYDYTADSLGMRLSELNVDGETLGRDAARADFNLKDITGTARVSVGELREISQSMTTGGLEYDAAFKDPETGNAVEFTGTVSEVSFEGDTTIPLDMDPEDMPAMLAAGFAANGMITHTGGSGTFAASEDGEATTGKTSSGGGNLRLQMDADSISYAAGATDLTTSFSGNELPFPIESAMSEASVNLTMPVSKSEEASDVALGVNLAGFTMSDMLWDIFDSNQVLPRDPATVAFDLTGKVKMLVDLMDAEQMAAADRGEITPAEPQSLTLSGLLIEAIGARVTGDGAFTFDNSDLATFDGMPRPEGSLNVTVNGANGVIDKLIQMGFLKEEDAMGARMMLSMFSVPAGGEDELKSTIEITEQGHVLANGQRIK